MTDARQAPLRRAGRLASGGGETVVWSVAEGRRGRRWRSLRLAGDGHVRSDLLLELDGAGRWARLELASGAGMLTLHPEPGGGAARGNVVTPAGMRHLALPWGSHHRLVIEDEPVAAVALAGGNAAEVSPGLVVTADLEVEEHAALGPASPGPGQLPGPSWPLELDHRLG